MRCWGKQNAMLLVWLLFFSICPSADDGFPRLLLSNGSMEVSVYLPDSERGYYRGTRFDWSGIIDSVLVDGHKFYGPLHAKHDPERHDSISGPAEEFAMYNPMGFSEASNGESFVKIGVGLLRKGTEQQYRFDAQFEVLQYGERAITYGESWVEFAQSLDGDRG